ncbi:MAG: FtsQ-type POTRA domain-containing protein [Clostridiales Family XIII bacterium]|jgi:cell division protein FtsQ|nr:FtsQ-type POTRA domain-containing protein [Clostridiales Family XIII bacterium]
MKTSKKPQGSHRKKSKHDYKTMIEEEREQDYKKDEEELYDAHGFIDESRLNADSYHDKVARYFGAGAKPREPREPLWGGDSVLIHDEEDETLDADSASESQAQAATATSDSETATANHDSGDNYGFELGNTAAANAAQQYQPSGKKRKKRKKKHYLLKFFITIIVLVGIYFFATSSFFNIVTIDVDAASHYTAAQIEELSGIKRGHNIFKTSMHEADKKLMKDPYIQEVKISRHLPDTIQIIVSERMEVAGVKNNDDYIIIDGTGEVLRHTAEAPALPIIEGLTITGGDDGQPLGVDGNDVQTLSKTLTFIKDMEQSDMYFYRIVTSEVHIKAYVYDQLAVSGTYRNITSNIDAVKKVIVDLGNKGIERGTIEVSGNGTCAFTPEIV